MRRAQALNGLTCVCPATERERERETERVCSCIWVQEVADGVYLGGLPAALELVSRGLAPASRFHLMLGMAGWGAGQLQAEVARGLWHVVSASPDLCFPQAGPGADDGVEAALPEGCPLPKQPDAHASNIVHSDAASSASAVLAAGRGAGRPEDLMCPHYQRISKLALRGY